MHTPGGRAQPISGALAGLAGLIVFGLAAYLLAALLAPVAFT